MIYFDHYTKQGFLHGCFTFFFLRCEHITCGKIYLLSSMYTALRGIYKYSEKQKTTRLKLWCVINVGLRSHISFLQRWSTHKSLSSGVCCYLLPNLGHHFPKAENNYLKKTHTQQLCALCSCLTSVTASPHGEGCKRVKKRFVCHRNKALLLSSFRAQCRETAWKCESAPSRAVTEL